MATDELTIQSSIKNHSDDSLTSYALFLGGVNATHDVLQHYDPLKTGYGRLFCVRAPQFVEHGIPKKWKKFKHILEYANTAVSGINDMTMNFNQLTGGYAGKSFEIPSHMEDGTNSFSVKMYEFSGSPIREVVHYWLNGIADTQTGLCHYNGVTKTSADKTVPDIAKCQANQTAEFIYVATDNTGMAIEYACMFANCIPKTVDLDPFNYESGQHNLVETTLDFTCTKYESIQINGVAQALIDKYRVLTNSMNLYSGIKVSDDNLGGSDKGIAYDPNTGQINDKFVNVASENFNTPRPKVVASTGYDSSAVIDYQD